MVSNDLNKNLSSASEKLARGVVLWLVDETWTLIMVIINGILFDFAYPNRALEHKIVCKIKVLISNKAITSKAYDPG